MDSDHHISGSQTIFRAEFRVMFALVSHDPQRLRKLLGTDVFQPLRKIAEDRGVLLTVVDPYSMVLTSRNPREEALKQITREIHGYHPVFLGIIEHGTDLPPADEEHPWLAGMHREWDIASAVTEKALSDDLMRDRLFLHLPSTGTDASNGNGTSHENRITFLSARARERKFPPCRRSFSNQDLHRQIFSDLKSMLDRAHPPRVTDSPYDHHLRLQNRIIAEHHVFYVETEELKVLDEYLRNGGAPIVVTGGHGSGKSALLANWTEFLRDEKSSVPVLRYFIGAGLAESDHGMVLHYLMTELENIYAIIPENVDGEAAALSDWIAQIRNDPFLIVVDGLDHLDQGSQDLAWLPNYIPPNVRLIVSTVPGSLSEQLLQRSWRELAMSPFTPAQIDAIIRRHWRGPGEAPGLDLLKRFNSNSGPSPLFLLMTPHEQMPENEEGWKHILSSSFEELFEERLTWLEGKYGKPVVGNVFSFLSYTQRGLESAELAQIIDSDLTTITDLLADCRHWIREDDGPITLLHDHISAAIREHYCSDGDTNVRCRITLAEFFAAKPATPRRADEEPWQWMQSGDLDGLATCLSDISMFMILSEDQRRQDLLRYWVRLDAETMEICYRQNFANWEEGKTYTRADVAKRLGLFFSAAGRSSIAEYFLQHALNLQSQVVRGSEPIIADIHHDLAESFRQAGKFEDAKKAYSAACTIRRHQADPDLLAITRLLSDVGLLYRDWGYPQKAMPFYRKAMQLQERMLGPEHHSMAERLNDLALLYHDRGSFAQAAALYDRALDIGKRHFGPHHPIVATILNNLGGTFLADDKPEKARKPYEEALEIRERVLGPDHPFTLISLMNKASLLHALGEPEEARVLFERAITGAERVLAHGHPYRIALNISYVQLLRDCDEFAGVEEILRETLGTAVSSLGPTHPYVAACANNLAGLLRQQGLPEESVPFYLLAIAAWQESYGAEHEYIGYARSNLIGVLRAEKNGKATEILADAIAQLERLFPEISSIIDLLNGIAQEIISLL